MKAQHDSFQELKRGFPSSISSHLSLNPFSGCKFLLKSALAISLFLCSSDLKVAQIARLPSMEERNALPAEEGNCRFTLSGDFLFLHASQEQMDFAWSVDAFNTNLPNLYDIKKISPNFSFDPGVRISLMYGSKWSAVDFTFNYLYFDADRKTTLLSEDSKYALVQVLPSSQILGPGSVLLASEIENNWHLNLHYFDFEIGRASMISDLFMLRPFFGVRGLSVRQIVNTRYSSVVDTALPDEDRGMRSFYGKSNFPGVGPRLGMNAEMHLSDRFSLLAKVSGSLLWGDFDQTSKIHINDPTLNPCEINLPLTATDNDRTRAIAELFLGLQYANQICDTLFTLSIGYESIHLWKQMVLFTPYNQDPSGDLSLHGGVFRLGIRL